jgi:ABC-2 type transport system permease protein
VFLFIGALLAEEVLSDQLGLSTLASLVDPFGLVAHMSQWEFWTAHEKNTRLLSIGAPLLWNRLVWCGVTLAILAFTRLRFRRDAATPERRQRNTLEDRVQRPVAPRAALSARGRFGSHTTVRQLFAIAGESARGMLLHRDFAVASFLTAIVVVALGSASIGDNFGTPFWPLTQFVAPLLAGFLPSLAVALLTTFYAGELIHRERDAGLAEIADVAPVSDWVLYAGRFLALVLVLVALEGMLMASGLLVQILGDYFHFELGLYASILFGLELSDHLLLAALAMLVHVALDNKYLGHLVVVSCYLFTVFARRFGLHHNLLVYRRDSGWVYSDISGFGPFLEPVLWFRIYWAGWALLFVVTAGLLWIRGYDREVRTRLSLARLRFGRGAAIATTVAALIVVSAGGYVFYNTNVLAGYRTPFEQAERSAEYERRYGRHANAPQPTVTGTRLHVEIDPERRVVDVRGTYALRNATALPIRTIHLFLNPEVVNRAVSFDRPSRVTIADEQLGHRTHELARPLQPGESLQMSFDVQFAPRGFPNSDPNTSVVGNGTYFDHNGGRRVNHRRWLPLVGYQTARELAVARTRQRHGLPARPLARSIDEPGAADSTAGRETITFEAVIGTSADQIAVAPGTLLRSWRDKGRRYFHYATERPVKNAFAIFSADYAVHRETHKGVLIELFHHPTHTFNVRRFARGVRTSLDYYTKNFGPYPHRQIRIAEFPRYANLAHAYPGTISYAEATGWVTRVDESRHFDLASMTVAHEVAHQWWGFQVMPAAVEGGPMVSEVLSQYSALMVIEKLYGVEMVRRFLWNTRIEYLNRRGMPEHPEVPLLLVTAHPNLVYRKGPLAMYALRHYIGEEPLNAALRRLVEKHGSGQPPFVTSRDVYRELQAATPAEHHGLLADLLETITLWSLRTEAVSAEPAGAGAWRVTLDVEARKLRADGIGRETEAPMNDLVEIGVFAAAKDGEEGEPLYLQKHRIRSGRQRVTVVVKGEPASAGIDPHLLLIDRNWADNVRPVKTAKPS